jgi:hypothetical protein
MRGEEARLARFERATCGFEGRGLELITYSIYRACRHCKTRLRSWCAVLGSPTNVAISRLEGLARRAKHGVDTIALAVNNDL